MEIENGDWLVNPLRWEKGPKNSDHLLLQEYPSIFLDSLPTWWLCRTGKCWNTIWFNGRCNFNCLHLECQSPKTKSGIDILEHECQQCQTLKIWFSLCVEFQSLGGAFGGVPHCDGQSGSDMSGSWVSSCWSPSDCRHSLAGIHLAGKICWIYRWI